MISMILMMMMIMKCFLNHRNILINFFIGQKFCPILKCRNYNFEIDQITQIGLSKSNMWTDCFSFSWFKGFFLPNPYWKIKWINTNKIIDSIKKTEKNENKRKKTNFAKSNPVDMFDTSIYYQRMRSFPNGWI